MTTTTTTFHVALNVTDLPRAISFYRAVLGREPAKQRADYAKFELADPPLALALNPVPSGAGAQRLAHLGIRVGSAAALEEARARITAAGIPLRDEGETVCCYALQRKFWVADPDGNEWEFYELLEDTDVAREQPANSCCAR